MSLLHRRLPFPFFALALVVLLASSLSLAQSSPPTRNAPPLPPPPPAVDQEQFISYWTTETGWRTELQLRNNAIGQILAVTPVLRTPYGTEMPLSPVTIKPQEVKTVDIAAAIGSSEPQLIGTYGSLVLRYHTPSYATLYAVSMVMGVGHSIAFHIDGTGQDQTEKVGSREGIWWMPNSTADDYFIIVNQGPQPLQVVLSLYDATGKAFTQNLTLPARGMNRLSVRRLIATTHLADPYGGIKVSAINHAGSLDTLHVLFDEQAGFSAVMKMFDYDPQAEISGRDFAATGRWTLRAPMLALSTPDPALAFPVGTILRPQIFVHNTTPKPINASLSFNWRGDSASGKTSGPVLSLNPYETRRIDVAALQDGTTLPRNAQWASVTLVTSGLPDEVVAVTASYDSTLHYGAQTPFSDQLAAHWAGGQWEYDPQHDSIITAGNGGTKPTQAAFTIFYSQGTQKYELEQRLQPGEQMWMDIGKLIRESVPDKNGKTLPADLTSGSYEFRDLTNKGVGSLFEGKVIWDRTYGHVTYGCAGCCGWDLPIALYYDPIGILLGGFTGDGVTAYNTCDAQIEDVSDSFYNNWTSGNTAIVTVDSYGTHSGVSAGSTTSQTSGFLSMARPKNCYVQPHAPGGGVNVVGFTLSGPQAIMDGQPGTFSVTVTGGTATAYQWSFTSPNGAGNAPNVNFTAATSAQTNTDGHWFAVPNVACPSTSDLPSYYNAVYTIAAQVTFSEGPKPSKNTTLTVNSYWNPAGFVDPNVARIGGLPDMASDGPNGTGTWRVTGIGTLSRVVPTSPTIYVIPTSQFYNKTVQHEQVHVNNWILGAGHLYGDLYIPGDFYNQITSITGTSQNDLMNKLSAALTTYVNSQAALASQRLATDEHQAFLVSDPIAPQYVYQNCGRY